MTELNKPSAELSSKLLSELSYEERLVGYEVSPVGSNEPRSLYSFTEATEFLSPPDLGECLIRGGSASMGYVDLAELVSWVGATLGDTELAAVIVEETKDCDNYYQQLGRIGTLMAERLKQCREAGLQQEVTT